MLGRVEFTEVPGKNTAVEEQIGGMPCLCLKLYGGERKGGFRKRREVRWIKRMISVYGVKHILAPKGFSLADEFWAGMRVDFAPFNSGISDLLALGWLEGRGIAPERAVVGLSAPRMSREVRQAAERLSTRVRGLRIDIPGEGANFADWLHREYGIPIREGVRADVTLLFGGEKRGVGAWIDLSERRSIPTGLRVRAPELQLPLAYEEQVMAVMWGRGMLSRAQIRVIGGRERDFLLTNAYKVNIMP